MFVLVDGLPGASIPVTDSAVVRGDGCFEAIRSYDGRLFALDEHLARLEHSAAALRLPLRDRGELAGWCKAAAVAGGEGIVRIIVTRGPAVPGVEGPGHTIVMHHGLPSRPDSLRLGPVHAPWHPAGRPWELSVAKTISYAPNLSASRSAVEMGFDDAVLLSDDGTVLEGPTFAVGWVKGGALETPALDLLILPSITRAHALELARRQGIEVREGRFPIDRALEADEFMAFSTTKEVMAVVRVGSAVFEPGPVAASLAVAFTELVAQATYRHSAGSWQTR